jgi:hypothetical protein
MKTNLKNILDGSKSQLPTLNPGRGWGRYSIDGNPHIHLSYRDNELSLRVMLVIVSKVGNPKGTLFRDLDKTWDDSLIYQCVEEFPSEKGEKYKVRLEHLKPLLKGTNGVFPDVSDVKSMSKEIASRVEDIMTHFQDTLGEMNEMLKEHYDFQKSILDYLNEADRLAKEELGYD